MARFSESNPSSKLTYLVCLSLSPMILLSEWGWMSSSSSVNSSDVVLVFDTVTAIVRSSWVDIYWVLFLTFSAIASFSVFILGTNLLVYSPPIMAFKVRAD